MLDGITVPLSYSKQTISIPCVVVCVALCVGVCVSFKVKKNLPSPKAR